MRIDEWMDLYGRIVEEFGFDTEADRRAAELLDGMVNTTCDWSAVEELIGGRDVIVVGAALGSEPPTDGVLIAADGATTPLLDYGFVPDIVVTDLDGDVEDQIRCSEAGKRIVIHAHGDNVRSLEEYVPEFHGKVCGTTQVRPFGSLRNFGGFTDGDRAVMLADELGARSIRLAGFRFDILGQHSHHRDPEIKMAKLQWAKRIISTVTVEILPVE